MWRNRKIEKKVEEKFSVKCRGTKSLRKKWKRKISCQMWRNEKREKKNLKKKISYQMWRNKRSRNKKCVKCGRTEGLKIFFYKFTVKYRGTKRLREKKLKEKNY